MATHGSLARGRVPLLPCTSCDIAQAVAAVDDLVSLGRLGPDWQWRHVVIIAPEWRRLEAARVCAEALGLPKKLVRETAASVGHLRVMQVFTRSLPADRTRIRTAHPRQGRDRHPCPAIR